MNTHHLKSFLLLIAILFGNFVTQAQNLIYQNNFDVAGPGPYSNPYLYTPDVMNGQFSNTKWTVLTGSWTSYNGNGGNYALATNSAAPATKKIELSMDVAAQEAFTITGFSFYHRSSSTGYNRWDLTINDVTVASGDIFVDVLNGSSPMHNTGVITLSSPIENLAGTVHVDLVLSGGNHGSSATFRFDEFKLFGSSYYAPGSGGGGGSSTPVVAAGGATNGVFNVSNLGASSYTIPIKVPTGFNGVEPDLSLSYNSQSGNGVMGMGWSLGGVSAISRISNSIYNDQNVSGINLSLSDKFAIDGNRLILASGSYGTDGSVYHTENESFKKIVANGTLGDGPSSFTVTDENGWTYEYGTTANALLQVPGIVTPYLWLLQKVTDRTGNFMTYEYTQYGSGEVVLSQINYEANSSTGLTPQAYIVFDYVTRSDPQFVYVGGGKMQATKKLNAVTCYQVSGSVGRIAHKYKLDYTDDVYTHLTSVTESGKDNTSFLNPTQFTYYGSNAPAEYDQIISAGPLTVPYEYLSGDFNGDGKADVIQYTRDYSSTSNTYNLYTSTGNGFNLSQSGGLPNQFSNTSSMENLPRNVASSFFDFNGDGKEDFVYKSSNIIAGSGTSQINQDNYNIMMSTGTGLTTMPERIVPFSALGFYNTQPFMGDFDGDGKTEILALKGSNVYSASVSNNVIIGDEYLTVYAPGVPFQNLLVATELKNMPFDASYMRTEESKLYVIDYDGDGKNEMLSIWHDNANSVDHAQVFKLNVTFDANHKPVIGDPAFIMVNDAGYPTLYHDISIGDFNGDGITDVLTFIANYGWEIGYGKGNGQMNDISPAPISGVPNFSNFYRPVLIADFNGDGKSDIYTYSAFQAMLITPTIYYSKGNNVFLPESFSTISSKINAYKENYWLGDYNGDGGMDLITKLDGNWPLYQFAFHPNEPRHLLFGVNNGLGSTASISYLPLTDASVYSPGSNVYTYPYIKKSVPFKLVASVNSDNGIDYTGNNTNYTYAGLKFNAWGKGLMGFDAIASHDLEANIDNTQKFTLNTAYAFPYLQTQTVSQTTGGPFFPVTTILSQTNNDYHVYDYGNGSILTFPAQVKSMDNLTGTTVVTDYTYTTPSFPAGGPPSSMDIGKPMAISINKGNGLDVSTQNFTFPNMGVLGGPLNPVYTYINPTSISTTNTRQGQSPYTRTTAYTYSPITGLLATTTADPGTANAVTNSMEYNPYAQATQKFMTAPGLPLIAKQISYDPSNRFVAKSYNPSFPAVAGNATFDPVSGNILVTTAEDGLTTTNTYEGFGRLRTITDNNGAASAITYGTPSSFSGIAPSIAAYGIETMPNAAQPSYEFYDRLGRLVRKAHPAFSGGLIYEDITYTALGQIASKTKPYFANSTPQTISFDYDSYGRVIKQTAPEGNTTTTYALSGGNHTITVTDPAGQQKSTTSDASGVIKSVTDNGGTLNYTYHSNGQPLQTTLSGSGTVAQITYDDYGRAIEQADPNYGGAGKYLHTYNAYGQTVTQQDPLGNSYSFTYDVFGNMLTKTGDEGQYVNTYTYTAGPNCGKKTNITAPGGVTEVYDYGMGEKIYTEQYYLSGKQFSTSYTYDDKGRLKTSSFPNGKEVTYEYNSTDGELQIIGSPVNGTLPFHYICRSKNALGQITSEAQGADQSGATVATNYTYDIYNLMSEQKSVNEITNTTLKRFQYNFELSTGNLLLRKDPVMGVWETFTYDNLNRLTNVVPSYASISPLYMYYSPNGNITDKSDAGNFTYDQANRLSRIDNYSSNIPETEQNVTYTPFNRVATISQGIDSVKFGYWSDGNRDSMAIFQNGNLQKTKYYLPKFEREVDAVTGQVRELCYITGPNGNIVAILETKNGVDKEYYVVTDHLGSIMEIIDENGTVIKESSFDAWGRKRDPHTWMYAAATGPSDGWDRGYTGQEEIPQFGIINLNGRLYDPVMGRMFSPDSKIPGVYNTQGYNRYSYALNNPLLYTDPDGKLPIIVAAMIVGAIVGAYMGGSAANANYNPLKWNYSGRTWSWMLAGAVVGAASSAASGGIMGSGMPFANTMGIVAGSFINSVGTAIYTGGQTGVSASFGVFSINLGNGALGYLGKSGNSVLENIGYGFGALANIQDLFAGMNGVTAKFRAETYDIQHARLNGEYAGKEFDISVAHVESTTYKWTSSEDVGLLNNMDYARYWLTHLKSGKYYAGTHEGLELPIYNVNGKWLTTMFERLGDGEHQGVGLWGIGKLKYGTTMFGCQSHVAHALLAVGIPTLPINFVPQILYGQLVLRQIGIHASPIIINK